MSENLALTDEAACDYCHVIARQPCPGIEAHCAAGQHCTSTEASCAASASYDHPSTCENCGAAL